MAYESLAEWFEYLNDDCDYPKWSQYFIEGLARLGAGKKGLELGCGSGAFSRALARAGYAVSGADNCLQMLTKAERLAREEGLRIPFFLADAATLSAPDRYDFILAPNDVYNYIPQERLSAAFRHAAKCLERGGWFWFDVSTPHKLRGKVGNTVSCDDRDEVTYLSFAHLFKDRVELEVTLFVRRGDGLYERLEEKHTQYIHEEGEIVSALRAAGFEIRKVEGHLGEDPKTSDRWNFICRKE